MAGCKGTCSYFFWRWFPALFKFLTGGENEKTGGEQAGRYSVRGVTGRVLGAGFVGCARAEKLLGRRGAARPKCSGVVAGWLRAPRAARRAVAWWAWWRGGVVAWWRGEGVPARPAVGRLL